MPYDPVLADRIRDLLHAEPGYSEKKMFGGTGHLLGGHMAAGAYFDGRLMVRCAREDHDALVAEPGAEGLRHGKRKLTGWILVDAEVVEDDTALATWVEYGRAYAASLPTKG